VKPGKLLLAVCYPHRHIHRSILSLVKPSIPGVRRREPPLASSLPGDGVVMVTYFTIVLCPHIYL
jgi:hypothetical protein